MPRPHGNPDMRIAFVCLCMCGYAGFETAAHAQLPPGVVRDPGEARIVYDDLDRFAAAYHRLDAVSDTAAFLDGAYLQQGTEGLRVYAGMYGVDAASLRNALREHPDRFAIAACAGPSAVRHAEPEVRRAMTRLAGLYPDALFPPVYHLIGPQVAGGAVQREGVLIAVETYAQPGAESSFEELSELTHLVAHELVHFQQAAFDPELYQSSNSLLARAIKEGVADFVAELISGRHINPVAHAYGERHKRRLWSRFREEMSGTATGDWFFSTPKDPAMPRDLGYFIGYRIAESRFRRESDPAAGVAALLRVSDYERFLEESGYGDESVPRAPSSTRKTAVAAPSTSRRTASGSRTQPSAVPMRRS